MHKKHRSGFIIGILLAVYGSFCLFPTFSEDYRQIYAYEPYIDADLPENGELDIQDWGHFLMMTKPTTLSRMPIMTGKMLTPLWTALKPVKTGF